MRDYAQLFDAYRGDWFEPNCLPDTRGAVVVDALRYTGVRLFAARLLRILTIFDA
jgi:hypothetical protein